MFDMLSKVMIDLAEANCLLLSDSVLFSKVCLSSLYSVEFTDAITAKVTVVYPVNVTKVYVDMILQT